MNIEKIRKIGIIALFVMEIIKVVALLGIWYKPILAMILCLTEKYYIKYP